MEEPAAEFSKHLLYTSFMLYNLSQFLMYLLLYTGTCLFAYTQPYGNSAVDWTYSLLLPTCQCPNIANFLHSWWLQEFCRIQYPVFISIKYDKWSKFLYPYLLSLNFGNLIIPYKVCAYTTVHYRVNQAKHPLVWKYVLTSSASA